MAISDKTLTCVDCAGVHIRRRSDSQGRGSDVPVERHDLADHYAWPGLLPPGIGDLEGGRVFAAVRLQHAQIVDLDPQPESQMKLCVADLYGSVQDARERSGDELGRGGLQISQRTSRCDCKHQQQQQERGQREGAPLAPQLQETVEVISVKDLRKSGAPLPWVSRQGPHKHGTSLKKRIAGPDRSW